MRRGALFYAGNFGGRERRLRTLLRRPPPHTSAVTSRQGNGGSEPCSPDSSHTSFRRRERSTGVGRNSPESRPIDERYRGFYPFSFGCVSSDIIGAFRGTTERRFIGLDSGELGLTPVQRLWRRNDVRGGVGRNRVRSRRSFTFTISGTE